MRGATDRLAEASHRGAPTLDAWCPVSDDGRRPVDDGGPILEGGFVGASSAAHDGEAARGVPQEVIGSPASTSRLDGRRRLLGRAGAAALLLAALVAGVVAVGPHPRVPLSEKPFVGLSIKTVPPPTLASGAPMVVATYRVVPAQPPAAYAVDAVVGPFIGSSAPLAAPAAATATDLVSVGVTPDCSDPSSLDAVGSPYYLRVIRTEADGHQTTGLVPAASAGGDWAAVIRRYCWARESSRSLTIEHVDARVQPHGHQVLLSVVTRNGLAQDVRLQVVDIADVATLDAADSGLLRPGAMRAFRVRLVVADCLTPFLALPTLGDGTGGDGTGGTRKGGGLALSWSVGPGTGDPQATALTALSPDQVARIRRAVRSLCSPPATSIHVVSARNAPTDPGVVRSAGVSLTVRLSVASGATRMAVGDDQSHLTADARVAFSEADLRPRNGRAEAIVIWHTRCTPEGEAPPLLPVRLRVAGRWVGYSLELADPLLARALTSACASTNLAPIGAAG